MNFTLTIIPQRQSYYHQTMLRARGFRTCKEEGWSGGSSTRLIHLFHKPSPQTPHRSRPAAQTEGSHSASPRPSRAGACSKWASTRRPSRHSWWSRGATGSTAAPREPPWKCQSSLLDLHMKWVHASTSLLIPCQHGLNLTRTKLEPPPHPAYTCQNLTTTCCVHSE